MKKRYVTVIAVIVALALICGALSMLFFYSDGEHLSLSEALVLTGAVTSLIEKDRYGMESSFTLESNELTLDGSSEIYVYNIDGKTVVADDNLYTCDGKTYTASGRLLNGDGEQRAAEDYEASPADMEKLLGVLLECYENSISTCERVDGEYIYTIRLDGEMTEELLVMLIPEIDSLGLDYNSGLLVLSVRGGALTDISVEVDAELPIFIATIPARLTVVLDFEAITDVPELPEAVKNAIFDE